MAERSAPPSTQRRLSLRARLLLAFFVPLVVALALVALVATTAVQRELRSQVDSRLADAVSRAAMVDDRDPPPMASPGGRDDGGDGDGDGYPGPEFLGVRGQDAQTLGARVVQGVCTQAGVIGDRGTDVELTTAQKALVAGLAPDEGPQTVDLGGELGSYRVVARSSTTAPGTVDVLGLPLGRTEQAVGNLVAVEIAIGTVALVGAMLTAYLVIRRTLRPLHRVATTATRVAELPLSSGEVRLVERVPPADTDTHTEVGQVGAALNRLLDHVETSLAARQASETQVRQFVADASHELRTPLASIRGYSELVRRSGTEVPPDVGHALRRVESEAVRMSVLVDDLLLLARLDAGREITAGEVDLSALAVDTVSDAHAAGPGHHWRLDLPDAGVLVPGDEPRLHQVLANLLANTRTHTPAGTTATVRLRTEGDWAVLQVVDDGPGIPPELVGHVFERFARGDSSRGREAGSTGLGLAIVHAVVAAHGGTVQVQSVPGCTTFTVRLPGAVLAPADQDPESEADPDDEPDTGPLSGAPEDAAAETAAGARRPVALRTDGHAAD
ncbi:HAMP domain-containing protein [Modestobacter sp. I12A-02628]|uniref:histidine kinase n=1 Tax=Goekera deserti TaxID=2497753 RepID=A0A7K3W9G3_9ACTN|nr:HAMP domain-containing sensor histidine kinase [Goekera deserti]MPQ98676.1 HAMP domain-containing protein [Goekera deserti]NDI49238.1 HAMP domain-containing protein [Goekera deserti]NEL52976.1 HAMP domain-containing histidine kinase [Goekera deserti]